VCVNNLKQLGVACIAHVNSFEYLPTAGTHDMAAPTYSINTAGNPASPTSGWHQDAGWGFQILPYLDEETLWTGTATTVTGRAKDAMSNPLKFFACPTRRAPAQKNYTNASFPIQTAYSGIKGAQLSVMLSDYAGCNGSAPPPAGVNPLPVNDGVIVSQYSGLNAAGNPTASRQVVRTADIKDGLSYTLMLGEKAANTTLSGANVLNEDDTGYAASFSLTNFNTIRFASISLLPLRDRDVAGVTGGAFGSAHPGTWNACMADGSVRQLSYDITASVFAAIATRSGGEIINDLQLAD
jgi:hypothetical protein